MKRVVTLVSIFCFSFSINSKEKEYVYNYKPYTNTANAVIAGAITLGGVATYRDVKKIVKYSDRVLNENGFMLINSILFAGGGLVSHAWFTHHKEHIKRINSQSRIFKRLAASSRSSAKLGDAINNEEYIDYFKSFDIQVDKKEKIELLDVYLSKIKLLAKKYVNTVYHNGSKNIIRLNHGLNDEWLTQEFTKILGNNVNSQNLETLLTVFYLAISSEALDIIASRSK